MSSFFLSWFPGWFRIFFLFKRLFRNKLNIKDKSFKSNTFEYIQLYENTPYFCYSLYIDSSILSRRIKAPRLQKQPIDNSGCFAYMPAGEFSIEKSYSPDSAVVYSGEIIGVSFIML